MFLIKSNCKEKYIHNKPSCINEFATLGEDRRRMKIIIIGCGKAGRLHRNIYQLIVKKAQVDLDLFYVDRLSNPLWGVYGRGKSDISEKVYKSIEEVIVENKLCAEDIIADICVPAGGMLSTIDACKRNGIRNL